MRDINNKKAKNYLHFYFIVAFYLYLKYNHFKCGKENVQNLTKIQVINTLNNTRRLIINLFI